ncbi:TA system antitoxin ParD family protein [Rhodococcus sp. 24CO]|uniref:TA system antitoxin ParD family protein n=1 Tax=Rhodococcus sp. 24CO TaxID=3117460 RepID=UPI003D34ACA0
MAEGGDKVTRFSSELVDAAAAEGEREHRSARQQLEHWARVGREVSNQRRVARRRVEAALAGRQPLRALTAKEGTVFNAEIAATLEESLATGNHVADRAAQGRATVVLDEQGRVVKHLPDGIQIVL